MPDSLILLVLALLAITIVVFVHKDAYERGREEGYNSGYRTSKARHTQMEETK